MNPPADWYPDPTGRHEQRYWDGGQWTEHVFTDGVQGVDPLEAATTAATTSVEQAAAVQDEPTDADPADPEVTEEPGPAFPAAYSEQTAERRDDDADADLWTPAGEEPTIAEERSSTAGGDDSADDDQVDSAVEADDVVATLDEIEAPADDTTPDAALQDAFVLSPETASRITGTSAGTPAEADVDAEEAEEAEDHDVADAGSLADAPPPTVGAIDAPPPTGVPTGQTASSAGLGITGDLVSGAFSEREDDGPVALQNVRLLRCHVSPGSGVVARQGTMVAYQGQVEFERQGAGGVGRALKRAATGEGMAMMRVEGRGDVFFADDAQHVFLLELDSAGPGISVNGRNVLAFSATLNWDIERVKGASLLAGGLFNTTLTGTGWVALVADGEPVVLRTDDAPTYVDVNALVAWSGGLSTRVVNQVSAKSLVGLGSGEAFQMAFDGSGLVIVQPSEGPMQGAAAT